MRQSHPTPCCNLLKNGLEVLEFTGLSMPRPAPTAAIGRFAPTPSGPLHRGSLLTALGSWLSARAQGGRWYLRIDDLDRPRCVPGAAETIQRQLEDYGLWWDGAVDYQSRHQLDYEAALIALREAGQLYACRCTRAVLAQTSRPGPDGPLYAGTCRDRALPLTADATWRCRISDVPVTWNDVILGPITRQAPMTLADFAVHRADGQVGYQLACVVDEGRLGITEVLRGEDLLGSTAQQIALFSKLGQPPPRYGHLPVVRGSDGRKLSKQNGAAPLPASGPAVVTALREALLALGHHPPPLADLPATPAAWLDWALAAAAPLPLRSGSGIL